MKQEAWQVLRAWPSDCSHLSSLGVIALFCRQYDIIKDNEPNNNKEKTKSASETSTPEHQGGGLLRSKVRPRPGLESGSMPCALVVPGLQKGSAQGLAWLQLGKAKLGHCLCDTGHCKLILDPLLLQGARGQL